MARLITKFKYLKGKQGNVGGYATYIATREGVDKIDASFLFGQQTKKQEELIKKILRDFPDSRDMHEYEDYKKSPTKGNASEFIARALEDNAGEAMGRKTYADYIATRPRAERFGSHGLFTDDGVELNLAEVSKELNEYEGNVWTVIISLRREDAERLGFNTGSRWRDMLRTQAANLAANFKIPISNLRWRAAFHNESHHPHVHLMVYSKNPREGYLTETGVYNLRSAFAKDLFAQDLYFVYEEQTAKRDELKKASKETVDGLIKSLQEGGVKNEVIEQKLILLSKRLANTKGKKVYGYLKADVKALVDSIVNELEKDERIKRLYDLWYEQKEKTIQTYTSELPPRIPLSANKEFKSIRNAVVQAAMGLLLDAEEREPLPEKEPTDKEVEDKYKYESKKTAWEIYAWAKALLDKESEEYNPDRAVELLKEAALRGNSIAKYKLGKMYLKGEEIEKDIAEGLRYLTESAEEGNAYAMCQMGKLYLYGKDVERDKEIATTYLSMAAERGNEQAKEILADSKAWEEKARKENITFGVFHLFVAVGRIFRDYLTEDKEDKGIRVDRKLRQRINEKKRAQGLKQ